LVIGSGAREHTIVWKLAQSPKVSEIFVAPGNAGTAGIARNISMSTIDIPSLLTFARQNHIDLTVVGPEMPLAAGIVDEFQAAGLNIFGATRNAARIEASKVFAKELMERHGLPSAKSQSFCEYEEAVHYVKQQKPPIVIKADGLAAGKGVTVAETMADALAALKADMQEKVFGTAGSRVVVEEYLTGREMSFFAFSDGEALAEMVPACDYKRVLDGNRGPNTGGMGSYSPPEFYTHAFGSKIMQTIMAPTIKAMREEGYPYTGVLYGGLMMTENGPKIIEFNARLGDPETQVVLPRLESDLLEVMQAVIYHNLAGVNISWIKEACVGVVLASGGYPGSYTTGFPISGLNDVDTDVMVFHAGTRMESGEVVTNGGRVLTVVATGPTLAEARLKVYNNVSRIAFKGMHYRKDIALVP
jgi:phosphoribosylamine--glycine ligase